MAFKERQGYARKVFFSIKWYVNVNMKIGQCSKMKLGQSLISHSLVSFNL